MPYATITGLAITTSLEARWESIPFWTQAEALVKFNEVLRWWNLLTGTWKTRAPLPTVANSRYYTVPGTMTFGFRVEWNGKPLQPASIFDLGYGRAQWRLETTASGGQVPSEPQVWAPVGITQFAIWPADAIAANSLMLDGIAETPVLPNLLATLDIDDSELGPLMDETLHLLAFKLGGPVWQATLSRHFSFLKAAADKNQRLKACSYFRKLLGYDRARADRPIRTVLDEAFGPAAAPQDQGGQ